MCLHLQLPAKDSYQRLWLCYEKLFFHTFFRDFLSLYKVRSPYCIDPLPLALNFDFSYIIIMYNNYYIYI